MDWLHVTGYVKGGWLRNEFSVPLAGVKVDFDRTSNYWELTSVHMVNFRLRKSLRAVRS